MHLEVQKLVDVCSTNWYCINGIPVCEFEFAVNFVILPVPVFERDPGTKVININTRIGAFADMYL